MKFGIAAYGMSVWDGGLFDLETRLVDLRDAGFAGIEQIAAVSEADALHISALFHRRGMDFATCRGPNPRVTIEWTAALGKSYVWTDVKGKDFDTFCRQVNIQVEAAKKWGVCVGLHNHMGTLVETQEQLESFLEKCPGCGLIFDTAHLAAMGGDAVEIAKKYSSRLVAVHLKDWLEDTSVENPGWWGERGRFCGLGEGNIGLDNRAVLREIVDAGFSGWVFIEHDTHLQEPVKDLAKSLAYLRDAGF